MNEPFVTTDVDLAAALRCHNLHPSSIRSTPDRFAEFVFPVSDALWQIAAGWARGDACLVDAREFGRIRRNLMRAAQRAQDGQG